VIGLDLGLTKDRAVAAVAHADQQTGTDLSPWLTVDGAATAKPKVRSSTRVVLDRMETWAGSRANPVRLETVEQWVLEAHRTYNQAPVVYDPFQAVGMAQRLERRGIRTERSPSARPRSAGWPAPSAGYFATTSSPSPTTPSYWTNWPMSGSGRRAPGSTGWITTPASTTTAPSPSRWPRTGCWRPPSGRGGWSHGESPALADARAQVPSKENTTMTNENPMNAALRGVLAGSGPTPTKALEQVLRARKRTVDQMAAVVNEPGPGCFGEASPTRRAGRTVPRRA
jgi:hypothetical protein